MYICMQKKAAGIFIIILFFFYTDSVLRHKFLPRVFYRRRRCNIHAGGDTPHSTVLTQMTIASQ